MATVQQPEQLELPVVPQLQVRRIPTCCLRPIRISLAAHASPSTRVGVSRIHRYGRATARVARVYWSIIDHGHGP